MKKLTLLFSALSFSSFSQICGLDNDLDKLPNAASHFLYNSDPGKNFCQPANDFDFIYSTNTPSPLQNGWFLIWNDQFNYSVLDRSFYSPAMLWAPTNGNFYESDITSSLAIGDTENIVLSGGRLKLFSQYNSNQNKTSKLYAWGNYGKDWQGNQITYHKDYTVGQICTFMSFPKNMKTEASIKVCQINQNTFPAWWLLGDNSQEIDMIEMNDNYPHSWIPPSRDLIMTHHGKKYGGQGDKNEEGIHFDSGSDLTLGFHTYELIWDKWVTAWSLDGTMAHMVAQYYGIDDNWNDNQRNAYYRSTALTTHQAYDSWSDDYFAHHNYYPMGGPMQMMFNIQLDGTSNHNAVALSPSNVGADKSFEMEYLKIWVRGDCDEIANVSSPNFIRGNSYINTGKKIYTSAPITVKGIDYNQDIRGKDYVIFAATEEIGLGDGFTVESGGNFFGWLSECSWIGFNKEGNTSTNIEGFTPGEIQQTIIDRPSETTAKNSFSKQDILIETHQNGFNVICRSGNMYKIEMLDSKGALVFSNNNPGTNEIFINKEGYAPGIYTLKINSGSGLDIRKIWIVR